MPGQRRRCAYRACRSGRGISSCWNRQGPCPPNPCTREKRRLRPQSTASCWGAPLSLPSCLGHRCDSSNPKKCRAPECRPRAWRTTCSLHRPLGADPSQQGHHSEVEQWPSGRFPSIRGGRRAAGSLCFPETRFVGLLRLALALQVVGVFEAPHFPRGTVQNCLQFLRAHPLILQTLRVFGVKALFPQHGLHLLELTLQDVLNLLQVCLQISDLVAIGLEPHELVQSF